MARPPHLAARVPRSVESWPRLAEAPGCASWSMSLTTASRAEARSEGVWLLPRLVVTAGESGAAERFGASGSAAEGREAADACEALLAPISEHLLDEEVNVLKLASRVISPPEWAALPFHALSQYRGDRVWLPFGLALEPMNDEMRGNLLSQLPPPVLSMWTDGGSVAFTEEMASIRGVA